MKRRFSVKLTVEEQSDSGLSCEKCWDLPEICLDGEVLAAGRQPCLKTTTWIET